MYHGMENLHRNPTSYAKLIATQCLDVVKLCTLVLGIELDDQMKTGCARLGQAGVKIMSYFRELTLSLTRYLLLENGFRFSVSGIV